MNGVPTTALALCVVPLGPDDQVIPVLIHYRLHSI